MRGEKSMLLEILVADRYLDDTNKAVNCAEGNLLKTRPAYGRTLVAAGLAKAHRLKLESDPAMAEGGEVEPVEKFNIAKLSIPKVLEAIQAGDLTPEQALAAERGRGDGARPTLIDALARIIGDDGDPATAEGGNDDEASG